MKFFIKFIILSLVFVNSTYAISIDRNYFNNNNNNNNNNNFNFNLKNETKDIIITIKDLDKQYIWTGGDKWIQNIPDVKKSLRLSPKTKYKIKIIGKKDRNVEVKFWIIMYDKKEKIQQISKKFDFNKSFIIQTNSKSIFYRVALRFAGTGKIVIKNIILEDITKKKNDIFYYKLRNLINNDFSNDSLFSLLKNKPKSNDTLSILHSFFPKLKDRKIINTGRLDKKLFDLFINKNNVPLNVSIKGYDKYNLKLPINWNLDPYNNRSWKWNFQYLGWTKNYCKNQLDVCGYIISDWFKNELFREVPLEFTWEDHSLAKRLDVVTIFLKNYINNNNTLDINILNNSLKLIISHLYALSSNEYYPKKVPYNHGLFMDIYLLKNLNFLNNFIDKEKLFKIAENRMIKQFMLSFTTDGIHIENSPSYHMLYKQIGAIEDIYNNIGKDFPKKLLIIQKKASFNLKYMIQPNNTFAQFGDTKNTKVTKSYDNTNKFLKDIVYKKSGYAYFRNKDFVHLSFTCNNLSSIHYHKDELSFSLFGYGSEIIVDSGLYNYNYSDPLNKYRYSAFGHNVLIVDNKDYKVKSFNGSSQIIDFNIVDDYSWVKGTHTNYKYLGVNKQFRTIIYYKPNSIFIIDSINTNKSNNLKQLFHFHPDFDLIKQLKDGSFLIQSSLENKPKLLIKPFSQIYNFKIKKGVNSRNEVQGWYFPSVNKIIANNVLEILYEKNIPGDFNMPVLIKLFESNQKIKYSKNIKFNILKNKYEILYDDKKIEFR